MKSILLGLVLLGNGATALAETPSHCSSSEQTIYSCQIKDSPKVVSLCASQPLSNKAGYVQYRFGRLGNIELEFPKEKQNSQKKFQYVHYFRYQVDWTEVGFKNGGYEYAVYDYSDGESKPPISETGVSVNKTKLLCVSSPINNLPALKDAIPCNEEKSLGSCK